MDQEALVKLSKDMRKASSTMNERDEDLAIIEAMRKYGGGFAAALARAALVADDENMMRIKATWPEYWASYKGIATGEREQGRAK